MAGEARAARERARVGASVWIRTMHVALLTLALLALTSTASAQDAERARMRFEQGVAAMDSGNATLAARYFEESYQLFPRASTACNLATSLERLARACDAEDWYRQCATIDHEGRFRDHANRQVAALDPQCRAASARQPVATPPTQHRVQVVEGSAPPPTYVTRAEPGHAMLAVGIVGLVLAAGAFVGGAVAAGEANTQAALLPLDRMILIEGTPEAERFEDARTLSTVAIGLYVGGSILGALGALAVIVDLAQPGVFGGSARTSGPQLALQPLEGGALGSLRLRF